MFEPGDIVRIVPFDEIESDGWFEKTYDYYFGISQSEIDARTGIDFVIDTRFLDHRSRLREPHEFTCYRLKYAASGIPAIYKWKEEMLRLSDETPSSDFDADEDAIFKFISEVSQ